MVGPWGAWIKTWILREVLIKIISKRITDSEDPPIIIQSFAVTLGAVRYMGKPLRLAGLPQTVPMCANLNMSAAVMNKLGKQRTNP